MSAGYYWLKKYRQKQSVEIEDEVQVEALTSRCDVPKSEQNQHENSNLYLELPIDKTRCINSLCPTQPTDTRNHDNDSFEYIDTPQDFSSQEL